MTMYRRRRRICDVKRYARAGVAATVLATALSACAVTAPEDTSLGVTRVAGPPLPLLLRTAAFGRMAGPPLQLVQQDRTGWVDEAARQVAAEPRPLDQFAEAPQLTHERPALALALPPVAPAPEVAGPAEPSGGLVDRIPESGADVTLAEAPAITDSGHDETPDLVLALDFGPIIAERPVGEPLRLIDQDRPDWLTGWNDSPVVAAVPPDRSVPLVLADGSHYWPASDGLAPSADEPCATPDGLGIAGTGCSAGNDQQIALAETAVDDTILSEMRGGYITAGGYQIDFGYYIETLVDGVTQLTSALTLNDMLAGNGAEVPVVGSVSLTGTGGTSTVIEHNLSAAEISATIENSQSNVDVSTIATLAIDVIDLRQTQIGQVQQSLPRMPMELQQSIIRGMR